MKIAVRFETGTIKFSHEAISSQSAELDKRKGVCLTRESIIEGQSEPSTIGILTYKQS